jgi:peptide/nickel transport system substrate-binding protein
MRSAVYAAVGAVALILPLAGFAGSPDQSSSRGGTLRLLAGFGPDHLDTVPAYFTGDYILERAYARQLLSYPAWADPTTHSRGWTEDITPAPDVATVVPTKANRGISANGRVYTYHLRAGVYWNTRPRRPVVAGDFVREFKAFCNPVSPVGNLRYFSETIAGMRSYCAREAARFAHDKHPTAKQIAYFQKNHRITGITTPNSRTIRFHLNSAASDFNYIVALPFASARPAEYDRYLPDSPRLDQHTISDGPYQITYYKPGKSLVMERDPAWRQSSDKLRHQYVNKIVLTMGVTSDQTEIAELRANEADLMTDEVVPTSAIRGLRSNPDFHIWPNSFLSPYLIFNFRSPNSRHVIGKLDVRRAVEYGINKVAVQQALGGQAANQIQNSVMPPGNLGSGTKNPYRTPHNLGSIAKCRSELATAGFRHGLTLIYAYPNDTVDVAAEGAIAASLRRCGITLKGKPLPEDSYFTYLGDTRLSGKRGTFDVAQAAWYPDWFGNDGRGIIVPLFQTHCLPGTNNYGCYSSPFMDKMIADAEAAPSARAAGVYWTRAGQRILNVAAMVPLIAYQGPILASRNVGEAGVARGVVWLPNLGGPDITNIWVRRPT